jgi:2-(1,2-epoxy-1,2-dihydrophenyl)acetyl-CoA isomerase
MPVRFEVEGAVAIVTIDRPQKMNAINSAIRLKLAEALERVRADTSIRVLVLTGTGKAFSAGQDLSENLPRNANGMPDLGKVLDSEYHPIIEGLMDLPVPTIAAINGIAAGAGASLGFACDLMVAAKSAKFDQAFSRIGLVPDCGSTWFLPRRIGAQRALALMLMADSIDADTAERWGLVIRVVEDERLLEVAKALALRLAHYPTKALVRIRKAVRQSATNTLTEQLDVERGYQVECGLEPDFAEGIAAFAQKRPPKFTGR